VSLYSFYPTFHALRWLEKTLACADLTSFYSQVRIHSKKLHVADQKQSLKASKTALNPWKTCWIGPVESRLSAMTNVGLRNVWERQLFDRKTSDKQTKRSRNFIFPRHFLCTTTQNCAYVTSFLCIKGNNWGKPKPEKHRECAVCRLLTRDRSIGKPVTRNLTIILLENRSVNVLKVLKKVLISKIDWKNAFRCRFLAFSYHVHRHVLPTDNFRRSIGLHFLCIFPTFTNNFAFFMHGCNIIMCLLTNKTILHD
jgi:hypothetical protein